MDEEDMEQDFDEDDIEELNNIIDLMNGCSLEQLSQRLKSSDHPNCNGKGVEVDKKEDSIKFGYNDFQALTSKEYINRDEIIALVREVAWKLGYATVIRKSKPDCYVILGCDRGEKYRLNRNSVRCRSTEKKRMTGTRLIDCPFEIWGKNVKREGYWRIEIKNLSHNHEPSVDLSGHPSYRRFSEEVVIKIKEMTTAGIPPRQILISLRGINPNMRAISRNVYNERAKIRKERLSGRTMIEALIEELGESDFIFDIDRDNDGHLSHLLIAHPCSIALTKSYSTVFLMDCTYKTNKYHMPLLNIVGVTSFNTSFFSCFVFMQKEETQDYLWALDKWGKILCPNTQPSAIVTDREHALANAIKLVFPSTSHLLCVWHIEKNVLTKAKKIFRTKKECDDLLRSWAVLIQSVDEQSFENSWSLLEREYNDKPHVLKYLRKWLPLKEKFVYAWTGKVMHLGNQVTSRVEGAHSKLKKHLQVSIGDLRGVKDKMCHVVDIEFHEINARLSSERIRVPHKFRIPFFENILGHVSIYALGEIFQQHEMAMSDSIIGLCRCHITSSMGLLCAHRIREMRNQKLTLADIHPQWRIDTRSFTIVDGEPHGDDISHLLEKVHDKYRKMPLEQKEYTRRQFAKLVDAPLPSTLEPRIYSHKGRPQGTKRQKIDTSTRRNPSEFEIVENSQACCSQSRQQSHEDGAQQSQMEVDNYGNWSFYCNILFFLQ